MSLSLLQANCSWRERGSDRKHFQPYALCLFSIMQCRAVMAEPVANTGKAWKNKPTSWSCWSAALLPQVHCVHFSFNQVELWLVVQAPDFHRKSARVTRKRPGATKAQVTAIARQEIIEIVWFEWLWWSYIYINHIRIGPLGTAVRFSRTWNASSHLSKMDVANTSFRRSHSCKTD